MRFVLDESVPQRLAMTLGRSGVDVSQFPNAWKGLKNGKLIAQLLSNDFQGLITCDKNLTYQQNLAGVALAVIALPSPFFDDLEPRLDEIVEILKRASVSDRIQMAGTKPRKSRRDR